MAGVGDRRAAGMKAALAKEMEILYGIDEIRPGEESVRAALGRAYLAGWTDSRRHNPGVPGRLEYDWVCPGCGKECVLSGAQVNAGKLRCTTSCPRTLERAGNVGHGVRQRTGPDSLRIRRRKHH